MGDNHILKFWDSQASKEGHNASWGDNWCVQLEIDNIAQYIKDGDRVLDVGCANGFAMERQARNKAIDITGIDFSEAMISEAIKNPLFDTKDFKIGNVKELPFEDEQFDVTYTTRCLINLPAWEEQVQGIKECIRVTKTGGTIILSEAFYEPLQKLNALRLICGLSPLVEHDFNRYLKKSVLEEALGILFSNYGLDAIISPKWTCEDFSSVYYLGSRFLRELVTSKTEMGIPRLEHPDKYPGYSNPINEIFYNLEKDYSGGGFGIQQAYIIRK